MLVCTAHAHCTLKLQAAKIQHATQTCILMAVSTVSTYTRTYAHTFLHTHTRGHTGVQIVEPGSDRSDLGASADRVMHQVLHLRCVLVRVCEWALWVCNVGCEPCTGQMMSLQTWSDPLLLRCTSSCSPRVPHSHTRPPPHARRNECMSSGWVTSAANTHLLDHLRNKPGLHVSEQPSFIPSHLREEGLYAQGAHTAPSACILPVCGSSKQARVAVSFVALREGSPH